MVGILPIRPNGVDHDLGLGNCSFDRRVVTNVYDENPHFMTELELSLDFIQLVLRPSCYCERERGRTGALWVRVEVLGYVFPGETW